MNRAIEAGTSFGLDQRFVVNNLVLTAQGEQLRPKRKPKDKVAIHEAQHAVFGASLVTIVPGDGYLGKTEPDGPVKPIQAVAPHAAGGEGTGHDLNIVRMMGYSPESLMGAARSELAAREEEVNAIAVGLEDEKTLTSSGIKRVIFEYKTPKFETAKVFVQNADGGKAEISGVEVRDNIVMMPNVLYSVASKANTPQIH
ncbi:MAG: hypothetical protein COU25_00670 [Candidatus Levybacteria bacterium CG10_big_fil_rev_8_21_14_0_10_35_13]|nr:MAG: hypothetical protein COU25_00670 [Candidatus Levybacteria bacterium CG10_big_fil_rev_8_21_14_0_10_35_13]